MNSKDFLKEGFVDDAHDVHLDHEVQMAREECYHAAEHALALHKLLRNVSEQQGLEGWVSAKITLANEYLNTVREHLEYELLQGQVDDLTLGMPIAEEKQLNELNPMAIGAAAGSALGAASIQSLRHLDKKKKEQQSRDEREKQLLNQPSGDSESERNELFRQQLLNQPSGDSESKHDERFRQLLQPSEVKDVKEQGVAEGKKSDRYHIVGKDGKPANLASYADKASAIKDRDEKYPGAVVQQVGPRGKVKGTTEGSLNEGQYEMMMRNGQVKKFVAKDDADAKRIAAGHGAKSVIRLKGGVPAGKVSEQGVAEGAKCNHTMEGENCPVHGLKECPMSRSQALAEWKKEQRRLRAMESSGGTSAGAVAGVTNPGGKPKSQVGSLFGGTYKQPKKAKKA